MDKSHIGWTKWATYSKYPQTNSMLFLMAKTGQFAKVMGIGSSDLMKQIRFWDVIQEDIDFIPMMKYSGTIAGYNIGWDIIIIPLSVESQFSSTSWFIVLITTIKVYITP
jgi:hypothetical protein